MVAALLLAACGAATTGMSPQATQVAVVPPTLTIPAPATQVPAPAPTLSPTSVAAPTAQAQAASATVPPTRMAPTFKGIEQGLNADGFPYLGKADAPITLTDYSDFL